eukprot:m.185205 g.185205  ORF g.185205 m.185205 type:complete len:484 (-) comp16379_c0_seq1:64-1515(-)
MGRAGEREPLLSGASDAGDTAGSVQHADGHHVHILYGRRWGILGVLCLLQIANAMAWVTYAPIAQSAAIYYGTSCEVIDGLSLIFMAVSIPGTFVSAWVLTRYGLRVGLVAASTLNAVGAALRAGGNVVATTPTSRLILQFIGQGLCSAAQPFALGCTTPLAQAWFGEEERAIANSISSLANPIGIALGSVLVPLVAASANATPNAALATLVPALASCIVTVLGMQAKPPTPPSTSAEDHGLDSFGHALKTLVTSWQYWLLFLSFGIGVGIFNAVATLMSQILVGQGYSEDDAGENSAVLIGAGIVGAALAGILLDYTKWFLALLKACFLLATGAFALFAMYQQPNSLNEIMGVTAVMGFFCFALLPVALELSVEITYPIPEAASSGFLWMSGQVFGITFTLIMNQLKGTWLIHKPIAHHTNTSLGCDGAHGPPKTMEGSCWFMVAAAIVATVIAMPLYTRYKRHEVETASNDNESSQPKPVT